MSNAQLNRFVTNVHNKYNIQPDPINEDKLIHKIIQEQYNADYNKSNHSLYFKNQNDLTLFLLKI